MKYELLIPESLDDAFTAFTDEARWFAGGTDLIPQIKDERAAPSRLVDLKTISDLRGIEITHEGVRIGAMATLAELAENGYIRANYRALAQACELAASPQIRNVATIGGNLCQTSRCPYYRGDFECYLKGGDVCFMRERENRTAAVIGYHDCVHVHPSDPANALVAFDAEIVVRGREGSHVSGALEFFHAPEGADRRMNLLAQGELIEFIRLPRVSDSTRSNYLKAMDRAAWTFALVSAAVYLDLDGDKIKEARIVLGAVAPTPWREFRIEEALRGAELNEDTIARAANLALTEAKAMAHNGYKIRLARAVLKRALTEIN